VIILFGIVFIDLIGFGLVIPLLPFYAELHGASPKLVTLAMASYSAAQLIAAPLLGRLSDRWGRRPILIISLIGSTLSYVWLGLAYGLWVIFASRLLAGACAGNIAAAQAYIADVTRPEERARGMGMIGAAFGLGFILGPALGGLLAGSNPTPQALALPAFVAAGLSFTALVGVLFVLPESLPRERRGGARRGRVDIVLDALRRPEMRRLVVLYFMVIVAFAGMETTFAMWAERQFAWGPAQVGSVLAFVGVLSAAVQGGLIGRLARRFGEERLLLVGLASICIGLLVTPVTRTVPELLAGTAFMALGMGLTQPSISSLLSRAAGPERQGESLGVAQSAGSFARIVGPALAGMLFEAFGRQAPFWSGALVLAFAVLLAWRLERREAPAPAGP
jgi:DHA1 family tetracycline resistance protein-like MFS transporter